MEFKFYDLMEEILNKNPSLKKTAVQDSVSDSHSEKGGEFPHITFRFIETANAYFKTRLCLKGAL